MLGLAIPRLADFAWLAQPPKGTVVLKYKLRFAPLALAVEFFDGPIYLEEAIKAGDVRLRGRFAPVESATPPGPPEDISLDTIFNSTIHFDSSRVEINRDFVSDDTGAHSIFASYIEVQVYVEDLEKIRGGSQSLKRGPRYTYDWDAIIAHSRPLAHSWRGSQNAFLDAVGKWVSDQREDGRRPDKSTLRNRLHGLFKEEQVGRKGGA
jgi:hypothetical protein